MLSSLCTALFTGLAAYSAWRCFRLLAASAKRDEPISVSLDGLPYARLNVINRGDQQTGPFKISLYVPSDQATFGLSGAFAELPTMRSGTSSIDIDDLSFSEAVYESRKSIAPTGIAQPVAQVAVFAHDGAPTIYWRFRSEHYSVAGSTELLSR